MKKAMGLNKITKEKVNGNEKLHAFLFAFKKDIPIMISYIFIGSAFGIVLQQAGYGLIWALSISAFIYTGAFQFVLASFFTAGASFLTIILTALFMNSRHMFYGLAFIDSFKKTGIKYPFMIHTLTDETFSVLCSCSYPEKINKEYVMFYINLLSWLYWLAGTMLGSLLGKNLPFDLTGIDFCMTALFVTIFIDQWKSSSSHIAVITGLISAILFLIFLGPDKFLLPALSCTAIILYLWPETHSYKKEVKEQ